MKEKLPLNGQDIKKLRKNLLGIILFPFVGAGMLYAFFSVFFMALWLLSTFPKK